MNKENVELLQKLVDEGERVQNLFERLNSLREKNSTLFIHIFIDFELQKKSDRRTAYLIRSLKLSDEERQEIAKVMEAQFLREEQKEKREQQPLESKDRRGQNRKGYRNSFTLFVKHYTNEDFKSPTEIADLWYASELERLEKNSLRKGHSEDKAKAMAKQNAKRKSISAVTSARKRVKKDLLEEENEINN